MYIYIYMYAFIYKYIYIYIKINMCYKKYLYLLFSNIFTHIYLPCLYTILKGWYSHHPGRASHLLPSSSVSPAFCWPSPRRPSSWPRGCCHLRLAPQDIPSLACGTHVMRKNLYLNQFESIL